MKRGGPNADLYATDAAGVTPLFIAIAVHYQTEPDGTTRPQTAVSTAIIKLLIDAGSPLELTDGGSNPNPGKTHGKLAALHLACRAGNPQWVQMLLEAGASIYTRGNADKVALHYAAEVWTPHVASLHPFVLLTEP